MNGTAGPRVQQPDPIQETALTYAALGWPVVPVWKPRNGICGCRKRERCDRPGKHPTTRHGYKDATTDGKRIAKWQWAGANIGISPGREAGLLVIDIDPRNGGSESIKALQEELGRLPACPVVNTGGGGWHLYFRHPAAPIRKSSGVAGIDIKTDGGFVVAPPSVHRGGGTYRWNPSPAEVPLPELPPQWCEWLAGQGCYIDHTRQPKTSQDIPGPLDGQRTRPRAGAVDDQVGLNGFINRCVRNTIPQNPGERHPNVFRLARYLRGHPEVAGWPLARLRPIVDRWYSMAVESVGQDGIRANADENWFDFAEGWEKIKYPGEDGLMTVIMERARQEDLPAVALQYKSEELRLLVALCRELQREVGFSPFFLATSTVAKQFGLKGRNPRMRAWRWLQGLVRDGVLELVHAGDPDKRVAAQFRYLHPVE